MLILFWPRIGYIFWGTKNSGALIFPDSLPCWWDAHPQHAQCNVNDVMPAAHMTCTMWHRQCMWCTQCKTHATHMIQDACNVHDARHVQRAWCKTCATCMTQDTYDVHDARHVTHTKWHPQHASHQWGRLSGKISASENVIYSGPEKCWKSLNILITSLA